MSGTRARRRKGKLDAQQRHLGVMALCWFLRWVLDEDERRALAEFRAAYRHRAAVLDGRAFGADHARRRLGDAERELQRRGR